MKKILSLVLVLSMFIMPIGMTSCFADGARKSEAQRLGEVLVKMKSRGLVKMVTVVEVGDKEDFTINFDFWGQRKAFLGTYTLCKESPMYECVEKKIKDNHVRETIKSLNCSKAKLVMIPYTYIIMASFLDKDKKVVKVESYPYKLFEFYL